MEQKNKIDVFIGIAALDKPYNQRLLKVYIPELYPFFKDKLTDTTLKEQVTINTQDGTESVQVNTSNVVTAEYIDIVSNRVFPPDIRKGEYVLVFRYRDNDTFYWLPLNISDRLRRLEVLRFAVSNSREVDKELNEDNTYYIELDTLHKKSIVIRTSKSDGEQFRYLIHIDAKNNEVHIEDDDDNYILLKSDIPMIKAHNKNNTYIELNRDDGFINTPRDLRITVGRMLYIQSESFVIDNKDAFILNTNNLGISGNNAVIQASTIGIDGSVKTSGTLVANAVRSGSYGTGSVDSMYESPSANTDIHQGSTTTPSPSPDTDDSSGTMRHAAAWEQVNEALNIITDCLDEINNQLGIGCSYSSIPSLAEQSKMERNKGE